MKIEISTINWQGDKEVEIFVNGVRLLYFTDAVPKQSNLAGNFKDIFQIPQLMELVYAAGRRGEPLDIIRRDYESHELGLPPMSKRFS